MTAVVTRWITEQSAYAVFCLMAIDALLPLAGELTMLYAGVVAGGVVGVQPSMFGIHAANGVEAFVALSLAGVAGSLVGALIAWWLGARGGRTLIDRHGRRLRLADDALERGERWFARYGDAAVLIGRLTPVVRSFISIAAGVLRCRLRRFLAFTLIAAVIWCFGLAAAGWALRDVWTNARDAFGYADVLVAAAALTLLAGAAGRRARA